MSFNEELEEDESWLDELDVIPKLEELDEEDPLESETEDNETLDELSNHSVELEDKDSSL